MIKVKYEIHRGTQKSFHPTLLDEYVIKLRRPRFDAILAQLRCDNSEHSDLENLITVNLSASECFLIEEVCCAEFKEKIINALMETCKK